MLHVLDMPLLRGVSYIRYLFTACEICKMYKIIEIRNKDNFSEENMYQLEYRIIYNKKESGIAEHEIKKQPRAVAGSCLVGSQGRHGENNFCISKWSWNVGHAI